MDYSIRRMLATRGAVVAAVAACGVGLALLAGRLMLGFISLVGLESVEYSGSYEAIPFAGVGFGFGILTSILPFTVGYFLGLWVVAPITEQLRIGHVIARAVLATGIGATLWFVVLALVGVISAIGSTPEILGIAASPSLIAGQLGYALQEALTGFIILLPLGALGGVFLWLWRSAHPAPHHIEGFIDV
ncbi:MAG: hypothetical protein LH616_12950 [Ilumatobacteraceae bacterium]|nr:hypothetical protein [Ilumatobacteraceae bacterium]